MAGNSRRREIEAEYNRDLIRFIIIAVLVLAILVTGICSCAAKNAREKRAANAVSVADVAITDSLTERESLEDITVYPRLVNNDNRLASTYAPEKLTKLYGLPDGYEVQMNFDAATAFYKLNDAMLADGLAIIPLSGYRSYSEQVGIYNYNLELHVNEGMSVEEATEYTKRFVAIPGASEHQYGRSIDVTLDGTTDHSFNETEQGQWLIEHAHEFGFVIRYPADKERVTGIGYEPWHLRYVGIEHAAYMQKYGLCLEEYVSLVLHDNPDAQPDG